MGRPMGDNDLYRDFEEALEAAWDNPCIHTITRLATARAKVAASATGDTRKLYKELRAIGSTNRLPARYFVGCCRKSARPNANGNERAECLRLSFKPLRNTLHRRLRAPRSLCC